MEQCNSQWHRDSHGQGASCPECSKGSWRTESEAFTPVEEREEGFRRLVRTIAEPPPGLKMNPPHGEDGHECPLANMVDLHWPLKMLLIFRNTLELTHATMEMNQGVLKPEFEDYLAEALNDVHHAMEVVDDILKPYANETRKAQALYKEFNL